MSEWNLSVRLTGQGSNLSRTLRDTARDARTLNREVAGARREVTSLRAAAARRIDLDVRVNSSRLRAGVRSSVRDMRQLADEAQRVARQLQRVDQDIQIRMRLDDGNLARRSAADARALREVREAAQDTARALLSLAARARTTARQLDDLTQSARRSSTALRGLDRRSQSLDGRLDTLSTRTRTLRGDMDDLDGSVTRVSGRLGGLRGNVGTLNQAADRSSGGTRNLMMAAAALGSALIPVAASLAPIAAGLAAVGAGTAAYGLAIGAQVAKLSEAADAQKKYDDAVRQHGKGSQQAAEAQLAQQQILQEMTPATREAAAALSVLKDEYGDWSDALSGDTMPVVTKSLQLFTAALPSATPLVRGMSDELSHLLDVAAGGMQTPGFDRFVDKLDDAASGALARMTTGVVALSESLDSGEISGDLHEFLDFAREVGPEVADTLGSIARASLNLLVAASDMGVSVLGAVDAVADLVNAIPDEALSTFIQAYAALKLLSLGMGLVGTAASSAAAGRLAAYFAVMRTAGVGTTLRATAASMTRTQKAAVGLGVLAIAAIGIDRLADSARGAPPDVDRLTTSLKNLARTGEFSGELKKTFGNVDGLVKKFKQLEQSTKDQEEYVDSFGKHGISALDDLRRSAYELFDDFRDGEDSLSALEDDFKGLDEALASLASSGYSKQAAEDFNTMKTALKEAGYSTKEINEVFPEYLDVVAALSSEQELAAQGMGIFGKAATDTKAKLDAQKTSADGLRASIVALNDVNRSAHDAQTQFGAAVDNLAESFKEHGATLSANTDAGRANRDAMSAAAKAQDELLASGIAAGESLGSMTKKSGELRESMLLLATEAFDGNKKKAQAYVNTLLGTPADIKTIVKLEREEAISGLESVRAAIRATPNAHEVKVSTLNGAAIAALEAVGLKTKQLPDGQTAVYTANGESLGNIGAVSTALNNLDGRTATTYVDTVYRKDYQDFRQGERDFMNKQADGGVVDFYADGGMRSTRLQGRRENHVAQIARAGSWRVWAEPETDGEGYVPFARSKRVRSRLITEQIVGRLGGDPSSIQWNADGSVTDWRYDPQTGSLFSPTEAGQAGRKTRKVKVKGKTKEVEYFDVGAVEKKLRSASKATQAWNKDLEKVADRVGGDVAEALASMGADGVKLADKMAKGSTKYINEMAAALRNLQKTAKASLTDYTRQLDKANKLDKDFANNLAKLASQGFGDLASQLAEQNDQAAMDLAAAAVKDKGKAGKADKAAKTANNALTSDQVSQLVSVIAAIKTSKTGIHDVAAATGLGEDEIIDVATKATGQIKTALGSRAGRFLADLAKAQKGMAYANGGIRAGMYATQAGIIRFAEPSTHGEAYVPFAPSKRGAATAVLSNVASRFGLGLTDANAGPSRVVNNYNTSQSVVSNVSGVGNAEDVARRVEDRNGYQLRRLARGGVGARG